MFAQKRRHSIHNIGLFVVEYFRGEELQSDGAVQVGVLGLVDDIHPAFTELVGDAVVRDRWPITTSGRCLHRDSETLFDDLDDLVGVAAPPVAGRENLDLARAVIALVLDHGSNRGYVDHAVAHHAAVEP